LGSFPKGYDTAPAPASVIGSAAPVTPGASGVARAWENIPPFDDHSELMGAHRSWCSQVLPGLPAPSSSHILRQDYGFKKKINKYFVFT